MFFRVWWLGAEVTSSLSIDLFAVVPGQVLMVPYIGSSLLLCLRETFDYLVNKYTERMPPSSSIIQDVGDQDGDYGHTGYQPRRKDKIHKLARARIDPWPSQQAVIEDDDYHDWFWRKRNEGSGVPLDATLDTNHQHAGYHSRQTNGLQGFGV